MKIFIKVVAIFAVLFAVGNSYAQDLDSLIPEGVWVDKNTGLMWKICPVGHKYDKDKPINANCASGGEISNFDFNHAAVQAIRSNFGGFSDWRMPSSKEFLTLSGLQTVSKFEASCIQEVYLLGKDAYWAAEIYQQEPSMAQTAGENYGQFSSSRPSCQPLNVSSGRWGAFKSFQKKLILVRGGSPSNEWATIAASSEVQSVLASEKAKDANGSKMVSEIVSKTNQQHPLLELATTSISKQLFVKNENASLEPIDWYVAGLKQAESKNKKVREQLTSYLDKKRLFDYKDNFSSPFDKQEFSEKLQQEKLNFVTNIFNYQPKPLPDLMVSFTWIALENYDFNSGVLTISTCNMYGSMGGGSCGGAGVNPSSWGMSLENQLWALSANDELVHSGSVQFVPFKSFFNGDNTGAPIYILSYGFPSKISFTIQKDVAKRLYELAKTTELPSVYRSEYGGKILSAKIQYGKPELVSVGTSNAHEVGFFFTTNGGAGVTYKIKPQAICIFDAQGKNALLCQSI